MTDKKLKTRKSSKKSFTRNRYMSLFFMDGVGNVFSFDRVKGVIGFLIILFIISILITGIAVKFALDIDRENQNLIKEVTVRNDEIDHLREENKTLTIRLVDQNAKFGEKTVSPISENSDSTGSLSNQQ